MDSVKIGDATIQFQEMQIHPGTEKNPRKDCRQQSFVIADSTGKSVTVFFLDGKLIRVESEDSIEMVSETY